MALKQTGDMKQTLASMLQSSCLFVFQQRRRTQEAGESSFVFMAVRHISQLCAWTEHYEKLKEAFSCNPDPLIGLINKLLLSKTDVRNALQYATTRAVQLNLHLLKE